MMQRGERKHVARKQVSTSEAGKARSQHFCPFYITYSYKVRRRYDDSFCIFLPFIM
jgi:hypothetical protein